MKKRITKGFTLVEIMIVVAIIGLLVAIALPNFLKARKKSMGKSAQASLKQIEGAIEQAKLDGATFPGDTTQNIASVVCPDYIKVWPVCPGGGLFSADDSTNLSMSATITDVNGGNSFTSYDTLSD